MLYAGFALLAISFAGITLAVATTPHGVIAVVMALGGLGLGFVMPNLTVFAQEAVPRTQLGIVTALLQSLRMIGGMLGTAAVGALVMALYQGSVEQAAAAAGAQSWAPRLADPQVLVKRVHAAEIHTGRYLSRIRWPGAGRIWPRIARIRRTSRTACGPCGGIDCAVARESRAAHRFQKTRARRTATALDAGVE